MSQSCKECVHNNPNGPSDLAYACLNCSWPPFAGEPTNFKPKPQTNADNLRAMTDEEIENWFWWMHKEMMRYTDSRVFLHDWLKQEVDK